MALFPEFYAGSLDLARMNYAFVVLAPIFMGAKR